jgi:hypothetical protein
MIIGFDFEQKDKESWYLAFFSCHQKKFYVSMTMLRNSSKMAAVIYVRRLMSRM